MTVRSFRTVSTAALLIVAAPGLAQVQAVDPNTVIDADLGGPTGSQAPAAPSGDTTTYYGDSEAPPPAQVPVRGAPAAPAPSVAEGQTYKKDDLIGAAEGVFGKGAKGLAGMIERILKDQGEPSGYIAGREASGAFVVGLRYGSGTLSHKIEGQRPVYWTGPSIGFDAGGNASSTFVLVYNLADSQELFQRFPAGEGNAYFVGGLTASYMRSGDVVLIPIRLGANVGYMKFSEKQNWLPF